MASTIEHLYAVVDYGSSSLKFVYKDDDKQPIQPVRRKMLLGQEENG